MNKLRIASLILVLAIAPLSIAEEGSDTKVLPVVFEDDFENGLDKWEFTDANAWKIENVDGNNVLSLYGASKYRAPVRSPHNIAWAKDVNVADFVLDVRLKQTGREYGHRDLCLFFGKQDPSHFYYVHMATKADDHANSVFLVNNKPRVSIAKTRTNGTKWDDKTHHVRIVRTVKDGTIKVYFDDMATPIMTAEDTHFTSGPIGVGSFDDVGHFDDLVLRGRKVRD